MFTLLADAMFTATLNRRGDNIPENPKGYADHYIPRRHRQHPIKHPHNALRDLW